MRTPIKILVLGCAAAVAVVAAPAAASAQAIVCTGNVLSDVVSVNVPIVSPGASECSQLTQAV
ncbi:hypothetical protein HNP84_000535 [Thermocatellispora tengchongensis]|uniref:Secreted protein n=1 Tax=Thermocatellispora tengchongensis TaxID=1073253 RepID=A0A840P0Q3_9ACTN|nr:hypothetical protein [Thermocatellispora tengchongensis]MBB5130847.1 hypothetical protein [Thermocatellispora tengchongensis]